MYHTTMSLTTMCPTAPITVPAVRYAARNAEGNLHWDSVRGERGAVGEPGIRGTQEVLILNVDEPGGGGDACKQESKI